MSHYAEHFELYQAEDYIMYLLMYQCKVVGKTQLKMATMTVRNQQNASSVNRGRGNGDNHSWLDSAIRNLSGSLEMAVPIQDIELYAYKKQ